MSFGSGSITFTNKPGGFPFASNAAASGTSIGDGFGNVPAGQIQWGQVLGDPANPAKLLDITEIPMNGQQIRFTNGANGPTVSFDGQTSIQLFTNNVGLNSSAALFATGSMRIENDDPAFPPRIELVTANAAQAITLDNNAGTFRISPQSGGANALLTIDNTGVTTIKNTITTGQPSANGSGAWKLGKFIAAAVALDNAHYIEVMIDGTIRKLLIST